MKRTALIFSGIFVFAAALALGHSPDAPQRRGGLTSAEPIEVTVTGKNICLGCTLKKEKGAKAQCSVYGHKHVLKVTKAVAGGQEMPAMRGWVLHYLETKASEDLIHKHHGATLTVSGKVYTAERVFEVKSVVSEHPKREHPSEHPSSEHPR